MCAGADCIDDVDAVRSGGMKMLFGGVYAPSTIGTLLQITSVMPANSSGIPGASGRVVPAGRSAAGVERVFIDIDSLLRPVYGHAKQGASYGHTKIAGKQVLRKGLCPLATTISTPDSAPLVAGMRLRAGKTGSGQGRWAHGRPGDRRRPRRRRTPRSWSAATACMGRVQWWARACATVPSSPWP